MPALGSCNGDNAASGAGADADDAVDANGACGADAGAPAVVARGVTSVRVKKVCSRFMEMCLYNKEAKVR